VKCRCSRRRRRRRRRRREGGHRLRQPITNESVTTMPRPNLLLRNQQQSPMEDETHRTYRSQRQEGYRGRRHDDDDDDNDDDDDDLPLTPRDERPLSPPVVATHHVFGVTWVLRFSIDRPQNTTSNEGSARARAPAVVRRCEARTRTVLQSGWVNSQVRSALVWVASR
jgi:hypothetical protein